MIIPIFLMLALFSWVPMFAKSGNTARSSVSASQRTDSRLLARMGRVRIVLKDGTMEKNCKVVQIKNYHIVYEKDGRLDGLAIESIERIEIQDGKMNAVFFDEKNKPRTGVYVY